MNLIVCLKQVPSTEAKIRVAPDGKSVSEEGVEWIPSTYDEYALEEALRIREAKGGGTITAITLGPDRCTTMLRSALALGADRAIHVKHPTPDELDALGVARILAAVIQKQPYDLVLFGKQGVGMDQALVPTMVAELLGLPVANVVTQVTVETDKVRCLRETEGGGERVDCSLPAVVTTQKGLNEPRIANLKGIMAAKKKPIDVLNPADLGVELSRTLAHEKYELPPPRQAGKLLQGPPEETARQLVQLLRNEAKVV